MGGRLFSILLLPVKITLTALLSILALLYMYPTAVVNWVLLKLKNGQTGAFDIQLANVAVTPRSITTTGFFWKNPFICGFKTPYFARIGSFATNLDIMSVIYASE